MDLKKRELLLLVLGKSLSGYCEKLANVDKLPFSSSTSFTVLLSITLLFVLYLSFPPI